MINILVATALLWPTAMTLDAHADIAICAMKSCDKLPLEDADVAPPTLPLNSVLTDLTFDRLSPPLKILPGNENLKVTFTRANCAPAPFGTSVTKYLLGMIATRDGATFLIQRDERSIVRQESEFANQERNPKLKNLWWGGHAQTLVAVIQGIGPSYEFGHYLGIWPHRGGSIVGYFTLKDGKLASVIPLMESAIEIQSVDFFPNLHDAGGMVSILRRRKNGSAELIDLSLKIGKLEDLGPKRSN